MTARLLTLHVARLSEPDARSDELELERVDYGRAVHEVGPVAILEHAQQTIEETDVRDEWYVLELWEEDENCRHLLDEHEIPRELADVLLDGKLSELEA